MMSEESLFNYSFIILSFKFTVNKCLQVPTDMKPTIRLGNWIIWPCSGSLGTEWSRHSGPNAIGVWCKSFKACCSKMTVYSLICVIIFISVVKFSVSLITSKCSPDPRRWWRPWVQVWIPSTTTPLSASGIWPAPFFSQEQLSQP